MPFSLGFWAAAGAGGGAGVPAYELISTTILGSNQASVTFSSIPQTYKHLQIRFTGRNTQSWGTDGASPILWTQVNGSSASSYSTHLLRGEGSSVSSASNTSLTYGRFSTVLSNAFGPTNAFSAGVLDVVDYTTSSTNKTLRLLAGYTSNSTERGGITLGSSCLFTTGAITSLTIGAGNGPGAGGNFVTGSRFSLYGIKG